MGTGDGDLDSIYSPNVSLDKVQAFCEGVCEEANGSGQDGLECFDGTVERAGRVKCSLRGCAEEYVFSEASKPF
jgi:hypothetical protein